MKDNNILKNRTTLLANLLIAVGCLLTLSLSFIHISCEAAAPSVDERLAEASEAIADNDFEHAQIICDKLAQYVAASDTAAISDEQAGKLAMLYMILSDQNDEDENVAVAAKCMKYAYNLSADSLHAFSASLTLDEQRHFELLHRITVSIDNPVDLSDDEFYEEGEVN